jgi:hypothetical protein
MFRRIEQMIARGMPSGYSFVPDPNAVAQAVLGRSTWAVLALTCHIELFVLAHYRESIAPEANLSPLWKDVFLHHWREESQHAILDELEWRREHEGLAPAARDAAVDDLIALVGAVDGVLQAQAQADAGYFLVACGRSFAPENERAIRASFLAAYRWQYIGSGVQGRFGELLASLVTAPQLARVQGALGPLLA